MVSVGIIDNILAPPLGLLRPHLDENGPFGGGDHTLTTWLNGGVTRNYSNTYGVYVTFSGSVPIHLGRTIGYNDPYVSVDEFQFRLVQICTIHTFFGGAHVVSQVEELHFLPNFVRWHETFPGTLGIRVLPNIAVDLYPLTVF